MMQWNFNKTSTVLWTIFGIAEKNQKLKLYWLAKVSDEKHLIRIQNATGKWFYKQQAHKKKTADIKSRSENLAYSQVKP